MVKANCIFARLKKIIICQYTVYYYSCMKLSVSLFFPTPESTWWPLFLSDPVMGLPMVYQSPLSCLSIKPQKSQS